MLDPVRFWPMPWTTSRSLVGGFAAADSSICSCFKSTSALLYPCKQEQQHSDCAQGGLADSMVCDILSVCACLMTCQAGLTTCQAGLTRPQTRREAHLEHADCRLCISEFCMIQDCSKRCSQCHDNSSGGMLYVRCMFPDPDYGS